jgi:hypothetical protein
LLRGGVAEDIVNQPSEQGFPVVAGSVKEAVPY